MKGLTFAHQQACQRWPIRRPTGARYLFPSPQDPLSSTLITPYTKPVGARWTLYQSLAIQTSKYPMAFRQVSTSPCISTVEFTPTVCTPARRVDIAVYLLSLVNVHAGLSVIGAGQCPEAVASMVQSPQKLRHRRTSSGPRRISMHLTTTDDVDNFIRAVRKMGPTNKCRQKKIVFKSSHGGRRPMTVEALAEALQRARGHSTGGADM